MKLALRDVEEADLPILFEHQADPEATRRRSRRAIATRSWRTGTRASSKAWSSTSIVSTAKSGALGYAMDEGPGEESPGPSCW